MFKPILITGCARSGTSLTAGIFHLCGAFGGEVTGPTRWNAKGQFENTRIRERICKPKLQELGVDPLGQYPLPDTLYIPHDPRWKFKVLNILINEGYDESTPWYYKGAKSCLMWPLWHRAFPSAKWIIVRRKKEDIVKSCLNTRFMRAYDDEGGWTAWVEAHEDRFNQMRVAGLDVQEVWTDEVVKNPYLMKPVVESCGLKWNEKEVLAFVTPTLWHFK